MGSISIKIPIPIGILPLALRWTAYNIRLPHILRIILRLVLRMGLFITMTTIICTRTGTGTYIIMATAKMKHIRITAPLLENLILRCQK